MAIVQTGWKTQSVSCFLLCSSSRELVQEELGTGKMGIGRQAGIHANLPNARPNFLNGAEHEARPCPDFERCPFVPRPEPS